MNESEDASSRGAEVIVMPEMRFWKIIMGGDVVIFILCYGRRDMLSFP